MKTIVNKKPILIVSTFINEVEGKVSVNLNFINIIHSIHNEYKVPIILVSPEIKISESKLQSLLSSLEKIKH